MRTAILLGASLVLMLIPSASATDVCVLDTCVDPQDVLDRLAGSGCGSFNAGIVCNVYVDGTGPIGGGVGIRGPDYACNGQSPAIAIQVQVNGATTELVCVAP